MLCSWLDIVEYEFEDHIDKVVVTVDGVFDAGSLPKGGYARPCSNLHVTRIIHVVCL